ncbi:hypothetical protein [Psychrobacillus soli]|uniref:Uncharacterized protein n=1 Tax=Psychrobacillus soli TaxID=1543965 RepID=A0A544TDV7_9BACI|nr:hypothetical protein [Psychrobacillus soli]TQR15652.1 hypothetical protein FG383_08700 [Psychrobacillus soli]
MLYLSIKSSILAGIFVLVLCLFLFATSIYGLVSGKVKLAKLQNRIEVAAVLVGSILLALSISLFILMNTILEYALEEEGVESKDKSRLIASTFFHVPTQRNLEKEMKNGITYLYPSGAKDTVEQFDTLLQEKKSSFDALFGNETMEPLMIEIYNDVSTLRNSPLSSDADGYYNSFNQSIHVVKIDSHLIGDWEPYLYKQLFEEELIYNEKTQDELRQKLAKDFSEQF